MLTLSVDEWWAQMIRSAQAHDSVGERGSELRTVACGRGSVTGTNERTLDLAEDLPDLLVALVALKIHPHDHRRHLKNANYSGSSVPYTQSDVHKKEARD